LEEVENTSIVTPLFKKEEADFVDIVKKRMSFCISNIHLAANLLDPRYRGKDLSPTENVQTFQKVYNLSREMLDVDENKVMAEFGKFFQSEGLHFPTMFHQQHGGLVCASIERYQKDGATEFSGNCSQINVEVGSGQTSNQIHHTETTYTIGQSSQPGSSGFSVRTLKSDKTKSKDTSVHSFESESDSFSSSNIPYEDEESDLSVEAMIGNRSEDSDAEAVEQEFNEALDGSLEIW
ncbi:hypothetical protein Anas_13841, partial [Armadillidium nasatum]